MDSTQLRNLILEEADKVNPVDVHDLARAAIGRLSRADRPDALELAMQNYVRMVLGYGRRGSDLIAAQVAGSCGVAGFDVVSPASTMAETFAGILSERPPGTSKRVAAAGRWRFRLLDRVSPHRAGEYKPLGECTLIEVRLLQASHETLAATHRLTAERLGRLADELEATGAATVADLPELKLRPILDEAA